MQNKEELEETKPLEGRVVKLCDEQASLKDDQIGHATIEEKPEHWNRLEEYTSRRKHVEAISSTTALKKKGLSTRILHIKEIGMKI